MLWWTLQQLKSSNWQTRAEAAARLQASNQRRGVTALIRALADDNAQVRIAVTHALAAFAHPAAAEALAHALSGLSRRPREERTGSEGAEYEALAAALGALKGAAVPALLPILDSDDKEARRWAAHALGLTRDVRAIEPLVQRLADNRSETRKAAALALGEIGDARAIEPLLKALAGRDPETRRAAAVALGNIGSDRAVDALCAIAEDPNEPVQLAVVEALRKIGGLRAAAGLRAIIDGARKSVRETASTALNSLAMAPTTAAERATVAVLVGDFQAAAREGEAASGALIAALASKDTGRRWQAAETLARLGAPGAVDPLLRALRDYDPMVQEAAVKALVSAGPAALDGLVELLSHHDPSVQCLAARGLGEIGDPRAVAALAGAIEQNSMITQQYRELLEGIRAAAEALAAILARNAAGISSADLDRLAGLPDTQVEDAPQGTRAAAIDCAPIRERARQELRRRGA